MRKKVLIFALAFRDRALPETNYPAGKMSGTLKTESSEKKFEKRYKNIWKLI